ncbi:uncharacterized protein LOC129763655 [Toxorhynchites rutilus septentrionalis]|uniref:uncharacterized protein LOC129763655 n=1 Tax=Toxorhynchites rutilus septentrionalis TaxID=329112 RepID=UPI0024794E6B|nr:uncharacterized protein LOC129763655 [Toxorhynchites rutilus septentrionalis]
MGTNTGNERHRSDDDGFLYWVWMTGAKVVTVMLILGCIKAILGCYYPAIGRWRYDYLQPTQPYRESSIYRTFLINILFFLVYPCVFCCRSFESRNEDYDGQDDLHLQQQGLLQGASVVQQHVNQQMTSEEDETQDEDELRNDGRKGVCRSRSYIYATDIGGNNMQEYFEELESTEAGELPYNNTEDEDIDANFALSTMNECRRSLIDTTDTNLWRSGGKPVEEEQQQQQQQQDTNLADRLVRELLEAKIVYRRMESVCGRVAIGEGLPYSIQGYFIAIDERSYQFFTHYVLGQFWSIERDAEGNLITVGITPRPLLARSFLKNYLSKKDVLQQNDLSVKVPNDAPCINIEYQF